MAADKILIILRKDGKSKGLLISKDTKISELFAKVRLEVEGAGKVRFSLIYHGTSLKAEDSTTVESIGIRSNETLDFCIQLQGGSQEQQSYPIPTDEPCSITFDDNPSERRYRMSCGCIYSRLAMKDYSAIVLSNGNFLFSCELCNKNWTYLEVREVLSSEMSAEQLEQFSGQINDNFTKRSQAIQKCPTCHNFVELNNWNTRFWKNYIVCPICTERQGRRAAFCWYCLKPWKYWWSCGNKECTGQDPRRVFLDQYSTKTIGNVKCVPRIRACPNCQVLIEHMDKCKHMKCTCGHSFCFVCLKPYDKVRGTWQCGKYDDICSVAPHQLCLIRKKNK